MDGLVSAVKSQEEILVVESLAGGGEIRIGRVPELCKGNQLVSQLNWCY